MHGVKRNRLTPQAAEAKRQKEQGRLDAYLTLEKELLELKKHKVHTEEALGKTNQMLDLNPEFYTIWNYRREILLALFPTIAPEEVVAHLANDLRLTTSYLLVHPKVYWIWNHRTWCLESVPDGPEDSQGWKKKFWDGEMKLVERMLDADPRNFHAWGYRQYVLSSLPVQRPLTDELKYTKSKISSNFSNFSAWHYRTKTLAAFWEETKATEDEITKAKDVEFELVNNALFTDPADQSGWLYHRWLIGQNPPLEVLNREIGVINELYEAEPDSTWCINALAHYTLLQAQQPSTSAEKAGQLKSEAVKYYRILEEVDSDRKGRYQDMAAACL